MPSVQRVKSGSKFEDRFCFSRLVKAGNRIQSSNTVGRKFRTREMPPDAAGPMSLALDDERALAPDSVTTVKV